MLKRVVGLILLIITVATLMGAKIDIPNHSAQALVLMESSSKRVLYEHNSHKKLPMASTTKIITALAIINNCNMDDEVIVDKKAVGIEGSSVYLTEGLSLSVKQLLYCLMLQSGNDSAVALAIHCSGSIEKFAELCNKMCRNIGLVDSHLTNPHGLHDDEHYTSAYDLAYISSVAMCNEQFKEIVSTRSIVIASSDGQYNRAIANKNKLLGGIDGANGIKTGYTAKAGRCFVGSATRDGMTVVCSLLNCSPMFENCGCMLEYAFSQFTMRVIVPQNMVVRYGNNGKIIKYTCKDACYYPMTDREAKTWIFTYKLTEDSQKDKIYQVFYDKQLLFSVKLVTI